MHLSIVIPVYKEDKFLIEVVREIYKVFEGQLEYEIIFVYDQGNENSWKTIKLLSLEFRGIVRGIKHKKNYGQHKALLTGIKNAKGDLVATMDDDLQYKPSDLKSLMDVQHNTGADLVYGFPEEYKHPIFRRLLSPITHSFLSLVIKDLIKEFTSFRLITKQLANQIYNLEYKYPFLDALLSSETTKIAKIKVNHSLKKSGDSTWTYPKLIKHIIFILIYYSNLPVVTSIFGIIISLVLVVLIIIDFHFSTGLYVLSFLGSFLTLSGLIALYLSRIDNQKHTSQIVIENT